jgi:hypothetical protein
MMKDATQSWQAPAWAAQTSEDAEDVDEPPERQHQENPQSFTRTPVRRPSEQPQPSLLTKAIMGLSDPDAQEASHYDLTDINRRRSMASNVSIASTADLTSDTGLTSPARTNTPSPPLPEIIISRLNNVVPKAKPVSLVAQGAGADKAKAVADSDSASQEAPRKRSIQFACNAQPSRPAVVVTRPAPVKTPSALEPTRRPCIKFACPARPASTQNTPPRQVTSGSVSKKVDSPSTPKKSSALAVASSATPRQNMSRKLSPSNGARPKYLRANSSDLTTDGSQFHEFAREMNREDDWLHHDQSQLRCKLTINDTLVKENQIRRLAIEAEEEAELDDEDEEAAIDDEGDDDEDADEDDENNDDDDEDEDGEDDDSDGYHTDEETGFAESDESDAEDENMILWTLSKSPSIRPRPVAAPVRRSSIHEPHSDSSTATSSGARRPRAKRVKPQQDAPDLPDSTDFVCGTLDEDRPLEEAYLSCMAARRKQHLRVIPQDIDPSFPASEPENEDDEDIYNPVHHSSDEELELHGKMEDIHHGQDRSRGRRKGDHHSPKRFRSPPPKRHISPPPKARGRSPKPLFERHSPRRLRSPAPKAMTTPHGSPRYGNRVTFNLAARPGPTITKSLPRPAAFFPYNKHGRSHKQSEEADDIHVRTAIDIVKGLEKKRQRRKEKFHQKYCNRARRGQIPERKPMPGLGAERMKELGLLMAGKKDQGNYVISI